MNYSNVSNLKFAGANQEYISCTVTFDDLGTIPFNAWKHDSTNHGKEIYNRAIAGEFGPITPADPIDEVLTNEQKITRERSERNARLLKLDALVSNPLRWSSFSSEQQEEFSNYRQLLLDVPQQTGFPENINWPAIPELLQQQTIELTFRLP